MKTITFGDATVSCHIERSRPVRTAAAMFPPATEDAIRRVLQNVPDFTVDRADQNKLVINYQSFVLRLPNCTALIDSCVGEHAFLPQPFQYDKTPYLESLAAGGVTFEDIDYVFCTHMHVDHVGWHTRLQDGHVVPTFPNARYIFSRREYEHMAGEKGMPAKLFEECIEPIVKANQAMLVEDGFFLSDDIKLIPTPGHSPGHVCVSVRSRSEHALFTGDLMHHVIQCIEPDWHTIFCSNPAQAVASRRMIFESHAGRDTILFPAHFPGPVAGRLKRTGDAFGYEFIGG